jgi:hypothetical protein
VTESADGPGARLPRSWKRGTTCSSTPAGKSVPRPSTRSSGAEQTGDLADREAGRRIAAELEDA